MYFPPYILVFLFWYKPSFSDSSCSLFPFEGRLLKVSNILIGKYRILYHFALYLDNTTAVVMEFKTRHFTHSEISLFLEL